MTLLRFEFIKVFRKRYLVISILLFTLVNFAAIFLTNQGYQPWTLEEEQNKFCIERLCGLIDQQKIDFIIAEDKRLNDTIMLQTFSRDYDPNTYTGYIFNDFMLIHDNLIPNLKYAVDYAYTMRDISIRANENISFYQKQGNSAMVIKNRDILKLYSNRTISSFRNMIPAKYLLFYDFSGLLIILLLVLTLTPIFISEKENRMNQLLTTFPLGEGKLISTKIVFIILVTALYCSWFFLMDLMGFFLFSNLQGLSMPLYSIHEFQFTPLVLSIIQFLGLNFFLRMLGMILIAFFISLTSKFLQHVVFAFLGSLFPLILYLVWQPKLHSALHWFDFFNPMFLLKNRNLFLSYNPIVLISVPVQPVFIVLFCVLLMLLLFAFFLKAKIPTRLV